MSQAFFDNLLTENRRLRDQNAELKAELEKAKAALEVNAIDGATCCPCPRAASRLTLID